MATLKGQNFRILTYENSEWKCIGMATNCVVTLTNNVDDTGTKDDVALAPKPNVTSKSWQVQVDSLNVADVAALLTAMKTFQKIHLKWDETVASNNQTADNADYYREGDAYLNDATFSFNNRENSAKNLQFTGASPLEHYSSEPETTLVNPGAYTKGQFVRLFIRENLTDVTGKVIAAARQLQMHVSLTLEDATTKDTEGDWTIQEPTQLSYDISTTALVSSGETITSQVPGKDLAAIEDIFEDGLPKPWFIANVNGANNRTKSSVICSGQCIFTQVQINAQNRQTATYTAQMQGYGNYTVGS